MKQIQFKDLLLNTCLKHLDDNFVQKCQKFQICVIYENFGLIGLYAIKIDHTDQSKLKTMILVKRRLWDARFNSCEVRFTNHLSDSSLLDIFLAKSDLLCIVTVAKL